MSQRLVERPPSNDSTQQPSHMPHAGLGATPTAIAGRFLRWLAGVVPTLLVLAALVAIGFYGHTHHWKLPSFTSIAGTEQPALADWCEEHGVAESQCVTCNPDLMPFGPDYGWCTEHGVHNCPLHHPDVAQLKSLPEVPAADVSRAAIALTLRDRPVNNSACAVYQSRIQFASVEAVQQAGVDVELVDREPVEESVAGNGEIRYDATRFASLSSRLPGSTFRVLKNVGDPVQEGEVLAIIDAMEVGRLKGELVKAIVAEDLARSNVTRLTGIAEGVIPGKDVLTYEAALAESEAEVLRLEQALANLGLNVDASQLARLTKSQLIEELRFLGLPRQLADEYRNETATANLIPIRSPMDGLVVERRVVSGEVVDPTRPLFAIADPSRMWLMLNVPLEDSRLLKIGQEVRFLPNGSRKEVSGNLSWISTAADRQTRMVQVRAKLENADGQLRDETFGAGRIILRQEPAAIMVPKSAVHWEGCCQIAFVRDKAFFDGPESPKVFHVRTVRTGAVSGNNVEILAGLLPGEVIVTEGSDVLRAQLLKNNLGAGCCAE